MYRLSKLAVVCLAAVPLAWLAAGCGGDSTPKKKTGASTTPPKTDEGSEKGTAPAKDKAGGGDAKGKEEANAGAAEGWGTIKGRIVYDGDPPEPTVIAEKGAKVMKADPAKELKNWERCSERELVTQDLVVNKENKGIKWVVVWIGGKPKVHPDLAKAEGEVEFGQEFCQFKPHVLALRQGQKLKVTASDPGVGHNTKISGFANDWNTFIPTPKEGEEKSVVDGPDLKTEKLPIPVQCNIHAWMHAYIGVFSHPYFAVTGDDGSFEIKNVPAGSNKFVIWHESGWGPGGQPGQDIVVKADETTDLKEIKLTPK